MPKIKFDKETKTFSIRFSRKKSVDSHIQDNVVIDFDEKGNVVNIEIMNFSLGEFKPLLKKRDLIPEYLAVERV
ncbi:MAG: DUF2283 domain-containing protein [Patescibacteria group bacterium]|nr:DUF2283 domain-containing protein [Patescibacteria group bacterium]